MIEFKKFGAECCGPCRAMIPMLTEIKSQYNNVLFTEYDVDTEFEEATKYGHFQPKCSMNMLMLHYENW